MGPRRTAVAVAACLAALTACGSGSTRATKTPTPVTTGSTPVTSPAAPSPTPSVSVAKPPAQVAHAVARAPRFRWSSRRVTAAELGKSWHAGCPVGPASLRAVSVTYWGFDHTAHTGTLVVNATVVSQVAEAFRRMYDARFPFRRIVPIAAYGGDDNRSMAADNTSGFNCRYAVANGPKRWSVHAYGEAIDIDTVENPYTLDGRVYPPAGKPYTNRSWVRPGMAVPGGVPVRAFSAVGWGWGGRWSSSPDYQHFSANGK
jgi:hypothetical protein